MLTHTATSVAVDTTMNTNTNMLTHMVTNAVADTTMSTNTLTHTATNAAAATTMVMSTNTLMHRVTNAVADTTMATNMLTQMVTSAVADTTMATNMLMYTDIMFPVILLTVIAKSAIRMRSTAMYAARAWLIAPAVCRMPIKLSVYIFCKILAVLTALPKWNTKSKSCPA